jgi:hypothetical protein
VGVDPFQAAVARIALQAAAGLRFALASGNALVAHGLVDRLTQAIMPLRRRFLRGRALASDLANTLLTAAAETGGHPWKIELKSPRSAA